MCDYDGGYYDGGYTEDIVHHDVVHHDVVHHDVVHDYYPHCEPHVDFVTPGIGIGVGLGVGVGSYGYPAPVTTVPYGPPVVAYGAPPPVAYGAPPPVAYVQEVVHPPGPVIYTREPEVSCCGTCTIL